MPSFDQKADTTLNSSRPSPAPPAPGSARELYQVALPLVISAGSLSLMHVIDRVFLTWLSTDALAASSPASMLHWTVMSVVLGLSTYVNTFVAQYEGAQRPDRVSASMWQGVYMAVLGGLILMAFIPLAGPIFRSVGHAPAVQRLEVEYFSVLCWGCVPLLLSAVLSSFYSGRGRTKVVMTVNLASVALNGGLDYCLIFGRGGFPAMGMEGAAWATVISKVVACLWFALLMLRSEERLTYRIWQHFAFDRELFGRLIRHGLPNGLQFLADILGFTLFLFLLGGLGVRELAASNLAFNINSLGYIPMMGMGTAVMTLVGQRVGAGTPHLAVRTTWTAFWISGSYTLAFALLCVTLPDAVLYPYAYSSDPEQFEMVRGTVHVLLRFVAVYAFFDAMAIVFSCAVRGAGDTRFSLIFTSLTCWLLMVLPAWLAIRWFGGGLLSGWIALTVYIVVVGLGFMLRFHQGRWKSMTVLEADLSEKLTAPVVAPPSNPNDLPEEAGLQPT